MFLFRNHHDADCQTICLRWPAKATPEPASQWSTGVLAAVLAVTHLGDAHVQEFQSLEQLLAKLPRVATLDVTGWPEHVLSALELSASPVGHALVWPEQL